MKFSEVLTDAGRQALESFQRILDEHRILVREMEQLRAGVEGSITIGALYYGLDEYLLALQIRSKP
ncbi:MAG: hypothetical protein ACLQBX_05100 [Candidatus Limnocylindrales bacterium]